MILSCFEGVFSMHMHLRPLKNWHRGWHHHFLVYSSSLPNFPLIKLLLLPLSVLPRAAMNIQFPISTPNVTLNRVKSISALLEPKASLPWSFPVAWKEIILKYSKITSHPFSLIVVITQLRCFLGLNLLHSTGEGKNTQGFTDDQILKITAEETHWRKQENWQTTFLGLPGSFLMKIKHGQHYFWFPRLFKRP